MITKKLCKCISVLTILIFLQSCEKKQNSWKRSKADRVETDRYIDAGDSLLKKWDYDKAYYYYSKAKLSAESKKDTSRMILSLINLATIHYTQTDYSGAETVVIETIPLLETKKDHSYNFDLNLTLGNIYSNTFDYENAIYCYNKASLIKTTTPIEKLVSLNNIAVVYLQMKEFKKAITILEPLITKKEILNDSSNYSRILTNLGYCYFKTGNPKALNYLNKSLQIRLKRNDIGKISSYAYLSEYYQKTNKNLANEYALLAYDAATKLKCPDDRLYSLKLLIQNSSANKSKEYSLKYLHINDSITKVRQKAKNQFAKIKYDSKKEKDENLKLKAQKTLQLEHQKKRNLVLYTVVGIITLISIFITNLLLARNKREKIKASYTTEIRIAKKLHDELANDVYHTMAFAETQDLSTTHNKEILISNLDTIYSRTRNISRENNTMETGSLFITNLKEMMSGFNTQEVNVITNGMDSINWMEIESNKKIIIYRILQELLVNMKKHSQCSLVVLSFKRNGKKLQIDYSDNGVGATFNQLNSKNGLQNVENRIQAIKGTITFDTKSNKGFKVQFIIPI